ncbi:hypothetical protein EIL87_17655 [Saccharopolyspora rhizosphaerae]|uniref:YggT family protein n=1 Tax=Saccharopolyspora rhizosphaerae TaxID=2492662 RepID=A0A426JPE0_9PSEU|nr:hypothetical protein [Saccharopolyspora rhizosphaerae]RRO15102.1 hypothetical protein EIL87_17655 [Saccharopolyspora rhizosphaerae]
MTEDVRAGAHEGGLRRADLRRGWGRFVDVLIQLVRWFGLVCAALLAIHVILTIGSANPDNGITQFVTSVADPLALGFQDLFTPEDPQLAVLLNYGIAAIFWLFITSIATKILAAVR